MKCKINGVKRNLRYRFLSIEGKIYILDMGSSLWKIVFAPFYWILPNTIYQVDDKDIIEKLKSPEIEPSKTGVNSLFGGAIAIVLANLLKPLGDYLKISTSHNTNIYMVTITVLIVISFYTYVNRISKNKLYQVIELEGYKKIRLWIWPESKKHFLYILFSYLFFTSLTLLSLGAFIQFPNTLILILGMIFLFLSMFISVLTMKVGNYRVRFRGNKRKQFS